MYKLFSKLVDNDASNNINNDSVNDESTQKQKDEGDVENKTEETGFLGKEDKLEWAPKKR